MNYRIDGSPEPGRSMMPKDLTNGSIAVCLTPGRYQGHWLRRVRIANHDFILSINDPSYTWDPDAALACRPLKDGERIVLTGTGE